ncbi:alpha-2A adrenergic receptor isoform X2 [Daphnia magna]|uniref:alpha-2A adrenergic receptor isoform X2 n=1 Tax=Daphnia magna TaxID=35525 RepID=UPI001E1BC42B|nr:alpha-2A adrenergic receptor isoform X2 [Daphnia magna]
MNETNSTATRVAASDYDVPIMALTVTFAQIVFRLTVVSVGMLLNSVVFLVVSCSRQLRYPRHIFWAAVALVDCLFLAQCVLELAVIVNHDHLASALDRYLAIVRYERYKRSVTIRATVTLLSCAAAVTFVIITSPFWTGHRSVHTCTIHLAQMYWVFAWNSLLGIFCVFLHVIIFVKSRKIIRSYFPNRCQPPITLKFVDPAVRLPGHHSVIANVGGDRELSRAARASGPARLENPSSLDRDLFQKMNLHGDGLHAPTHHADTECFPWMQGRSIVSRMEARAAVRMSVNLLPLWLCTFPISCTSLAIYWCIRLGGDCTILGQIMSYLRDVFLLHSIYNPVMYMCTSSEFRRAFNHIAWKLKIGCQTGTN